jgi:hypothetical protein
VQQKRSESAKWCFLSPRLLGALQDLGTTGHLGPRHGWVLFGGRGTPGAGPLPAWGSLTLTPWVLGKDMTAIGARPLRLWPICSSRAPVLFARIDWDVDGQLSTYSGAAVDIQR